MLTIEQVSEAAYEAPALGRTEMRKMFLHEVRSTKPPTSPLGMIYAGLLPQTIRAMRDPLKWIRQVTPGTQPLSDGMVLYNRHTNDTGNIVVGIYTEKPAGIYTPDLAHRKDLPSEALPSIGDLVAERYPDIVSRSPLDTVWFDPNGETPLYRLPGGVHVKQWNWAVCAGVQAAKTAVESDCVKLEISHPTGLRFARIPLHAAPPVKDPYLEALSNSANVPKPGSRVAAKVPVKSTIQRHMASHLATLELSERLIILLYKHFRGY